MATILNLVGRREEQSDITSQPRGTTLGGGRSPPNSESSRLQTVCEQNASRWLDVSDVVKLSEAVISIKLHFPRSKAGGDKLGSSCVPTPQPVHYDLELHPPASSGHPFSLPQTPLSLSPNLGSELAPPRAPAMTLPGKELHYCFRSNPHETRKQHCPRSR